MEDLFPMEVVRVASDAGAFREPVDFREHKPVPSGDDYFFWLASQDQDDAFPLFDHEIRALSPVPVPVVGLKSSSPPPPSPSALNDFDPDAFLDKYLCSPEGQAILSCASPPQLLEDGLEEFLTLTAPPAMGQPAVALAPEHSAVKDDLSSAWEFLLQHQDSKLPQETMDVAPALGGVDTSPLGTDASEETDISVSDDDGDPLWHPGGQVGSSDEDSEPSRPSRKQHSSSPAGRPSRKGKPLGPRQRRTKEERRERKKGQNRTAAMRYREKKRMEKEQVSHDLGELRANNIRLKTRIDTMHEDIRYFKNLMITVLQAKVGAC